MADPNRTTRDYLRDYLAVRNPGFAVLLAAPWGAGKTHLVRALIGETGGDGPLYVSLFGVRSREDIDAAIAQERLRGIAAGKLVRGVNSIAALLRLRGGPALSLSLAQIGRFEMPGFKLPDALIFDDLERTGLPPRDILGAINGFVERDGKTVILLANEERLWRDSRDEKEKVIGRTLPVVADIDAALPGLLDRCVKAKAFLRTETATIREVFDQAGFHNLRALGQSLWDFDRLYRVIEQRHHARTEGMRVLLRLFLALSLEVKAGTLGRDDLARREGFDSEGQDPEDAGLRAAGDKYGGDEFIPGYMPSVIPAALSVALICDGALEAGRIEAALIATGYFRDVGPEEDWRTIHFADRRPPDDVRAAFDRIEARFAARAFDGAGEILCVFYARLTAPGMGLTVQSLADIERDCHCCLEEMAAAGGLPAADPDGWRQACISAMAGRALDARMRQTPIGPRMRRSGACMTPGSKSAEAHGTTTCPHGRKR